MKELIQIVLAVVAIASSTGCATPYMIDRRRDLADIFTATVGEGIGGMKVRVGPFGTGLFNEFPMYGLRGGDTINPDKMVEGGKIPNGEFQFLLLGGEGFFGTTQNMTRGKCYSAMMRAGINIPVRLNDPDQVDFPVAKIAEVQGCATNAVRSSRLAYLTQIEIAGGLIGTVRLGFNPGELLDFLLGWFGIDIFDDDLEAKKLKEVKSHQVSASGKAETEIKRSGE
jgi:hypothetical protein